MKNLLLSGLLLSAIWTVNAQPQPKGEFHKYIVKKTDDERRKTKNQEWWNKGVIVFAETDIPRLGSTKEVEAMLRTSFVPGQEFRGRVYLPQSIGELNPKPSMIFYHLFIDGKKADTKVVLTGSSLPDEEWSSWLIDFPEYFKDEWPKLASGSFLCRIECWAAYSEDETTVFVNENDQILASHTEKKGKIKFLASGEFTWHNHTSDETINPEETFMADTTGFYSPDENPAPETIPDTWKEAWYEKNPVYKKPAKECDCNNVGCAELESIESITGIKKDNLTVFNCVVENTGEITSCETNAILRIMWNEEFGGNTFMHIQKKLPALKPKSKTTVVFEIENFWYKADEQVFHFIMDYDGNVAETEEMNLAPVMFE